MCVDKICKTPKILKEDFESISRSLLTRRTGKLKVCLGGKKNNVVRFQVIEICFLEKATWLKPSFFPFQLNIRYLCHYVI